MFMNEKIYIFNIYMASSYKRDMSHLYRQKGVKTHLMQ